MGNSFVRMDTSQAPGDVGKFVEGYKNVCMRGGNSIERDSK